MRALSCPVVDCAHNKDGGSCAAKRTVLKKRGALLECTTYRQSEEYKERLKWFDAIIKSAPRADQRERMTK
jgi:hypothetical protein